MIIPLDWMIHERQERHKCVDDLSRAIHQVSSLTVDKSLSFFYVRKNPIEHNNGPTSTFSWWCTYSFEKVAADHRGLSSLSYRKVFYTNSSYIAIKRSLAVVSFVVLSFKPRFGLFDEILIWLRSAQNGKIGSVFSATKTFLSPFAGFVINRIWY